MGVCRMVIQAGYRGPRSPHTSRTAYRHRLSSELSAPCWGCSLGSQVLGQGVCVREPLVWRQRSQASMRVARQIASLLWSHGRD